MIVGILFWKSSQDCSVCSTCTLWTPQGFLCSTSLFSREQWVTDQKIPPTFLHSSKGVNLYPSACGHAKSFQLCPAFCVPMGCRPPGSSVHGILQAGIVEWVAMPFSRGSSQPRVWIWASCIIGRFFTVWATREASSWLKTGRQNEIWPWRVSPISEIWPIWITCYFITCL